MNASDSIALTQAIAHANFGDIPAARAILTRLRSQYPSNPDVLLWLIFTSESASEARSLLDTLAWADPNNPQLPRARQWVAERERQTPAPPSATAYGQTAAYSTPAQPARSAFFLLNPKNAAFVEGRARKPRTAGNTITFFFVLFLFGAFLVAGVWLIVAFMYEQQTRDQLAKTGVTVQARIVSKDVDEGDDSTTYTVTYGFNLGQPARTYKRTESVDETIYNSLSEGESVPVRYLPGDPATSRFASIQANDAFQVPLGGLFALVGGIGVIAAIAAARKTWRVIRRGSLVYGEVVDSSSHEDSDNDWIVTVRYTFRTAMGQEIEGKTSATRNDLKKSPLPRNGTPVAILYADPQNHKLL